MLLLGSWLRLVSIIFLKCKNKFLFRSNNYKILIQKTLNSEFNISLVKIDKTSSGFFGVCSSKKKEESSVLIHNEILTNQVLNRILNCSFKSNKITKLGDFLEINSLEFIKLLKSLTILGLDQ